MTEPEQGKITTQPHAHSLPLKITGIVFWGLLLLGLIASALLIRGYEYQLSRDNLAKYYLVTTSIQQALSSEPPGVASNYHERFKDKLTRMLSELSLLGIEVEYANRLVRAGTTGTELAQNTVNIVYTLSNEKGAAAKHAKITIYHTPLEAAVSDYRKNILLTMGALCFAFGWVLQWILKRILTEPFLNMVDTAQAFSDEPDKRFDATRRDEFGFLSTFINKALDHLANEQRELRDALEREKQVEQALFQEKERAEVTLQSIADAVITTNRSSEVEYLNPVAEKLTGWKNEEARGHYLHEVLEIIDESTRETIDSPVERCLLRGVVTQLCYNSVLVRRDGTEIAIEDSAAPIRDRAGKIIGAVMVFQDVGHARALARKLTYQASHDLLTGLYNRHEFEKQLNDAIGSTHRDHTQHALCYVDLDQFKLVNDTSGHVAGDELLRQLSVILQTHIRNADILARLGGDEFGILLKNCPLEKAVRVADGLREAVKDFRFCWENRSFVIGASIGVYSITADNADFAEVMSAADMACYAAKEKGRNRIHVYEHDDSDLIRRRGEMQFAAKISNGLKENSLCFFYQPIISLKDNVKNFHCEILLRMLDENSCLLSPQAFLPAAQRFNLMQSIDQWVVQNLFTMLGEKLSGAKWRPQNCTVAVNLSGDSIGDGNFFNFIKEQFKIHRIPPELICFEITESVAISNFAKAREFIIKLKELGAQFALDDFGSGMSSFSYLKNLPVDYLKIDGSYVKDMVMDPMDRALVESVNQIGHILGMATVAEFVENPRILKGLKEVGVDYAQGYGIAKPKALDALFTTLPLKQAY